MEIRRLHANLNDFNDGVFEISGDEFNYAVKVLRQKQGFSVIVNVGDGYDYIGVITEIKKTVYVSKCRKRSKTPRRRKIKSPYIRAVANSAKTISSCKRRWNSA